MENSDNSSLGNIGVILGLVLGLLLTFATFFGIYHGFKKHDIPTGIIATIIPPYAWYLSAEGLFWHDDYSNVNWEIRLQNDAKAIVLLIGSSTNLSPERQLNHGRAIEELADEIKDYPRQKTQHLKDVASLYISYNESFTNDLIESINNLVISGDTLQFSLSKKTIDLENRLLQYKELKPMISAVKAGITNISEEMTKGNLSKISKADRKRIFAYLQPQSENNLNQLRLVRDQIFSEKTNSQ